MGTKARSIVQALVLAAFDADEGVRHSVSKSLHKIGMTHTTIVVRACMEYVKNNSKKIILGHRIILLECMSRVIESQVDQVHPEMGADVIQFAAEEMTESKDIKDEWQQAASEILVHVGKRYPSLVFDELLSRFPAGVQPHYYVVKTLGDFTQMHSVYVAPRLPEVMTRLVPALGGIRQENFRYVFAHAIGRFCEALLHYHAEAQLDSSLAPLRKDLLQAETQACFEVLFSQWLQSREARTRLATVEALGSMTKVITPEECDAVLPKLVNGVLGLFRREQDLLPVTQGLCMILESAMGTGSKSLESLIVPVMQAMAPTLQQTPSYDNPSQAKNFNEVLRCFELVARSFTDEVVSFVLHREGFESANAPQRRAACHILKHLVSRLMDDLRQHRGLLVAGCKVLVNDSDFRVRKAFAQLIITMASKNYLVHEGGQALVQFIVKEVAIADSVVQAYEEARRGQKRRPDDDSVSPKEQQALCAEILWLMTTTIPEMEAVLWPFLFEFFTLDYAPAFGTLARCVTWMATRKLETDPDSLYIDFNHFVNIPRVPVLVGRLLMMGSMQHSNNSLGGGSSGSNNNNNNDACNLIEMLRVLGGHLHAPLASVTGSRTSGLVSYARENNNGGSWDQAVWERMVLGLFDGVLTCDEDHGWRDAVTNGLAADLESGLVQPTVRRAVVLQMLGLCLRASRHKQTISKTLNVIFSAADHQKTEEQNGCARAMGLVASKHIDMVLEKMQSVVANDCVQRSVGWFKKDKSAAEVAAAKCSAVVCFGHVTANCPPHLLAARLEMQIINVLMPLVQDVASSSSEHSFKQSVITCFNLIANAMSPSALGDHFVEFKQRDRFVDTVLAIGRGLVGGGGGSSTSGLSSSASTTPSSGSSSTAAAGSATPSSSTATSGSGGNNAKSLSVQSLVLLRAVLDSLSTLLRLPPAMKKDTTMQILQFAVKLVELPSGGDSAAEEMQESVRLTIESLHNLLTALIGNSSASAPALFVVSDELASFMSMRSALHRERAIGCVVHVLRFSQMSLQHEAGGAGVVWRQSGTDMGRLLARLLPRCTDPSLFVRQAAIESVALIVSELAAPSPAKNTHTHANRNSNTNTNANINNSTQSSSSNATETASRWENIKLVLEDNDTNTQLSAVNDLSTLLAKQLDTPIILFLLPALIDGLLDAIDQSASGTCVILNGLIQNRGQELQEGVPTIVNALLKALKEIRFEMATNGTVAIIRTLARHHFNDTIDVMFASPLPLSPEIVRVVQKLSRDEVLNVKLLQRAIKLMTSDTRASDSRPAADLGNVASAVLGEMLTVDEAGSVVDELYPQILASILLRIGASAVDKNTPGQAGAVDTLRKFLERFHSSTEPATAASAATSTDDSKSPGVLQEMADGGWQALRSSSFFDAVPVFGKYLFGSSQERDVAIFNTFLPFASTGSEGQRIMTTSLAAVLASVCADTELVGRAVQVLVARMGDKCETVRVMGLRGLGNMNMSLSNAPVLGTQALSMLLSCIDDSADAVSVQALVSLQKLLRQMSDSLVSPVIVSICIKLRTAFDRLNADVRRESLALFEVLGSFGSGAAAHPFVDQIQTNLMCLLLNVTNENIGVRVQCRKTLKTLCKYLGSSELVGLVDDMPDDERVVAYASFDFETFADHTAKILVDRFSQQLAIHFAALETFFSNAAAAIRANSAVFAGYMVYHAKKQGVSFQNFENVSAALMDMLKEGSPTVRRNAALALSVVHFD